MAVKLAIVVLMSIMLSVYAKRTFLERRSYASACGKKEDTICKKNLRDGRPRSVLCKYERVQRQCPRLCGVCAPFTGVCSSENIFGCCWNGQPSLRPDKGDCPDCRNINDKFCNNYDISKDCDLQANSADTRNLCPETCGACSDYGN